MPGVVAVYLVTYRRHALLRRSLASALAQTHRDLRVYVVNDDPNDQEVADIVASFHDDRAMLHRPVMRRGAVANFNLVFREADAEYASLLEDDNWWEPTFLEKQIAVLQQFPDAPLVIGNERVWKELPDGCWEDSGCSVWPFDDVRLHTFTLSEIAGHARLCNSSFVLRVKRPETFLTPEDIPVDVSEHFRDRLLPVTVPLNGAALVNFAQTLSTARGSAARWSAYQLLLIGSVFAASPVERRRHVAETLWYGVAPGSPRSTTLVQAGLAFREARSLLASAPLRAFLRTATSFFRHPVASAHLLRARHLYRDHFTFLVSTPLTRCLAKAE